MLYDIGDCCNMPQKHRQDIPDLQDRNGSQATGLFH